MPDYKVMYFALFNKVTDALAILQQAQREGEEAYMEGGEDAGLRSGVPRRPENEG